MLVLWDLDQTLLSAAEFGQFAIRSAFEQLLHVPPTSAVPVAGRTDKAIIADLIRHTDPELSHRGIDVQTRAVEIAEQQRSTFRSGGGHPLPGATDALDALNSRGDVLQSVVTGNLEGIGRIKLSELGLDRHLDLSIGAFGDNHIERADLVALARDRAETRFGVKFEDRCVVVIGDTPLDIAAASKNNVHSIAVSTGNYTAADLRAAGADTVVPDLLHLSELLASIPA
ncbi:HAD family hydrolase [Nocardia sp. NPDC020380]|uniref:HAD family hydrolase n=1 Tax=Nocardia sp. NPDC020380 TaxID=3364309 RepID=UPI0037B11FCC